MVLSRELLDSILERAADEVFLLNPDGSLKYVNKSTLERRSYTREEMLQMYVWDWNSFVTKESWQRRWESLLEIKESRFQTRHLDKYGESFPVDIQVHYIRIEDAEYCVCFVNDISELARKVDQLDRQHVELSNAKKRADQALADLTNLQERRALLFATVAHELRTPISAISMLCSDDSEESWQEARDHIKILTRDLLHTLDDMRRLTKDDHKREITFELFSLNSLLDSVRLAVSAYITRYNMAFESVSLDGVDPGKCLLYGDMYRLKVVLSNLVKNACVHSAGSKVRLQFSATSSANNMVDLLIRVSDDGKGIPAEQMDALFSPYQRGSTDADGSGIGLHVARSWVEELGGSLKNIACDRGALFEVAISLKSGHAPSPDNPARASNSLPIGSDVPLDPSTLSVLFVEDDLMIQMVGTKLLSKLFGRVEVAGDGLQAVESLRRQEFDLVLTDYFMPNMNGLELIKQLRRTGFQGVIYACSAATLGSEFDELISAGANDVFAKPLTMNKLMACLESDADLFQRRNTKNLKDETAMAVEKQAAQVQQLLEKQSDKALLLIDLASGQIFGTERWRELNQVAPHQALTRTLLNETIAEDSREDFVRYSKDFFQRPLEAQPVSIELNLRGLDGRSFRGVVTSHKLELDGQILACTQVEEVSRVEAQ